MTPSHKAAAACIKKVSVDILQTLSVPSHPVVFCPGGLNKHVVDFFTAVPCTMFYSIPDDFPTLPVNSSLLSGATSWRIPSVKADLVSDIAKLNLTANSFVLMIVTETWLHIPLDNKRALFEKIKSVCPMVCLEFTSRELEHGVASSDDQENDLIQCRYLDQYWVHTQSDNSWFCVDTLTSCLTDYGYAFDLSSGQIMTWKLIPQTRVGIASCNVIDYSSTVPTPSCLARNTSIGTNVCARDGDDYFILTRTMHGNLKDMITAEGNRGMVAYQNGLRSTLSDPVLLKKFSERFISISSVDPLNIPCNVLTKIIMHIIDQLPPFSSFNPKNLNRYLLDNSGMIPTILSAMFIGLYRFLSFPQIASAVAVAAAVTIEAHCNNWIDPDWWNNIFGSTDLVAPDAILMVIVSFLMIKAAQPKMFVDNYKLFISALRIWWKGRSNAQFDYTSFTFTWSEFFGVLSEELPFLISICLGPLAMALSALDRIFHLTYELKTQQGTAAGLIASKVSFHLPAAVAQLLTSVVVLVIPPAWPVAVAVSLVIFSWHLYTNSCTRKSVTPEYDGEELLDFTLKKHIVPTKEIQPDGTVVEDHIEMDEDYDLVLIASDATLPAHNNAITIEALRLAGNVVKEVGRTLLIMAKKTINLMSKLLFTIGEILQLFSSQPQPKRNLKITPPSSPQKSPSTTPTGSPAQSPRKKDDKDGKGTADSDKASEDPKSSKESQVLPTFSLIDLKTKESLKPTEATSSLSNYVSSLTTLTKKVLALPSNVITACTPTTISNSIRQEFSNCYYNGKNLQLRIVDGFARTGKSSWARKTFDSVKSLCYVYAPNDHLRADWLEAGYHVGMNPIPGSIVIFDEFHSFTLEQIVSTQASYILLLGDVAQIAFGRQGTNPKWDGKLKAFQWHFGLSHVPEETKILKGFNSGFSLKLSQNFGLAPTRSYYANSKQCAHNSSHHVVWGDVEAPIPKGDKIFYMALTRDDQKAAKLLLDVDWKVTRDVQGMETFTDYTLAVLFTKKQWVPSTILDEVYEKHHNGEELTEQDLTSESAYSGKYTFLTRFSGVVELRAPESWKCWATDNNPLVLPESNPWTTWSDLARNITKPNVKVHAKYQAVFHAAVSHYYHRFNEWPRTILDVAPDVGRFGLIAAQYKKAKSTHFNLTSGCVSLAEGGQMVNWKNLITFEGSYDLIIVDIGITPRGGSYPEDLRCKHIEALQSVSKMILTKGYMRSSDGFDYCDVMLPTSLWFHTSTEYYTLVTKTTKYQKLEIPNYFTNNIRSRVCCEGFDVSAQGCGYAGTDVPWFTAMAVKSVATGTFHSEACPRMGYSFAHMKNLGLPMGFNEAEYVKQISVQLGKSKLDLQPMDLNVYNALFPSTTKTTLSKSDETQNRTNSRKKVKTATSVQKKMGNVKKDASGKVIPPDSPVPPTTPSDTTAKQEVPPSQTIVKTSTPPSTSEPIEKVEGNLPLMNQVADLSDVPKQLVVNTSLTEGDKVTLRSGSIEKEVLIKGNEISDSIQTLPHTGNSWRSFFIPDFLRPNDQEIGLYIPEIQVTLPNGATVLFRWDGVNYVLIAIQEPAANNSLNLLTSLQIKERFLKSHPSVPAGVGLLRDKIPPKLMMLNPEGYVDPIKNFPTSSSRAVMLSNQIPYAPVAYAQCDVNDWNVATNRLLARPFQANPNSLASLDNFDIPKFFKDLDIDYPLNKLDAVTERDWLKKFQSNKARSFVRALSNPKTLFEPRTVSGFVMTKFDETICADTQFQKVKNARGLVSPSKRFLAEWGAIVGTLENHFRRILNETTETFFASGAPAPVVARWLEKHAEFDLASMDFSSMDSSYREKVLFLIIDIFLYPLMQVDRVLAYELREALRKIAKVKITNMKNKPWSPWELFTLESDGQLITGLNITLIFNSLVSLFFAYLVCTHFKQRTRLMMVGDDHCMAFPRHLAQKMLEYHYKITAALGFKAYGEVSHWTMVNFCSQMIYKTKKPYNFTHTLKIPVGNFKVTNTYNYICDWECFRGMKCFNYNNRNPIPIKEYVPQFLKSILNHRSVPFIGKIFDELIAMFGLADEISSHYKRKNPTNVYTIEAAVYWELDEEWWTGMQVMRYGSLNDAFYAFRLQKLTLVPYYDNYLTLTRGVIPRPPLNDTPNMSSMTKRRNIRGPKKLLSWFLVDQLDNTILGLFR